MADGEIPVRRVTMWLCDLCLNGAGGECHTPGCALWINRAPDLPLRNSPFAAGHDQAPRSVTYDLSSVDRYTELTAALEDRAAAQRKAALLEGGNPLRERWADLDDQMREQAEAAFSGRTEG